MPTFMNALAIVNPNAGSADAALEMLSQLQHHPNCDVQETQQRGHAADLARRAIDAGVLRLIAAGGDGTINEILNGIAPQFGRIELAIIPLGTGNDLARSLNLPRDLHEATELALTGQAAPMDVARFRGTSTRYFLNASAGGFSGVVDQHVQDQHKDRWGSLAYVASAVAALPNMQTYQVHLALAEQSMELAAYNIVIANGRYAGGGIPVAPDAILDDGLFDIAIVPAAPLAESAQAVLQILLGQQNETDSVITMQSSRVRVRSQPLMPINVDGELLGETDGEFDLLKRALRIVAEPKCPCLSRSTPISH